MRTTEHRTSLFQYLYIFDYNIIIIVLLLSIKFRFDYDEPKPTNDWVIPITLTCGAAYSTTVWLENNPETRVTGYISASNGTWILANQHQTG